MNLADMSPENLRAALQDIAKQIGWKIELEDFATAVHRRDVALAEHAMEFLIRKASEK